ncbi:MAG: sigma-70 family RNA polymerase sigma factor, partial [Planctomycetota bacterium]
MSEIPQTRQSLLLALANRSEDAWLEFLEVYENALFRFAVSKGLQEADARDVVQHVLEVVLNRLPTWDSGRKGSFRAWLFRVARNIAVDVITARVRKANATGDTHVAKMLSQVPTPAPDEDDFEAEYRKSLFDWASKQVRSEVRDATWKAFSMTALEGRTAEDVAGVLGVTVGSVYTSKCRVVARIKARIAELEDG